jgi:hypothetical protein
MTRLMAIAGGGQSGGASADIVIFCKNCGLKCSLPGLSSGCHTPVDLVVIGVSWGGKEVHYFMLLDLPVPVTWTPLPQV